MSANPTMLANSVAPNSLQAQSQLRQRWDTLGARERRLVLIAALVVGTALLWWIALGPALSTLKKAQAQHTELDAQLQQMQGLKAQAGTLAALPRISVEDARRLLDASLKQTLSGTAQMVVVGNRATVTLKGASPDLLAQWLLQARINARAVPSEVRLVKAAPPATPANPPANPPANSVSGAAPAVVAAIPVRWDGTVVLTLPGQ